MSDAELRDARHDVKIGGPIALISVGGAIFLLGTPILLSGVAASSICSDSFSSGAPSTCSASNGFLAVGAAMVLGGAGVGIGGGVWLGSSIGKRKSIDRELDARSTHSADVRFGVLPAPAGMSLGFSGTF